MKHAALIFGLVLMSFSTRAELPVENVKPAIKQADSVIVVFKEEATSRSKKGGKSALEKAAFKSIKGLEKSIKHSLKKTKKSKKGAAEHSRAARNLNNMYVARVADGMTLSEALQELKKSPLVEYAEPDWPLELFEVPNDPYFNDQWSLSNTGQLYKGMDGSSVVDKTGTPGADIDWLNAYTNTAIFPTNGILIAVVDTGVDYTHQDLTNQMWINTAELNGTPDYDDDGNGFIDDIYGYDIVNGDGDPYDDQGHGTHCAGTIAAETGNAYGIAGVCPSAKIMAVKMFDFAGRSTASSGLEGIEYAATMGAKVISCSWGGGGYSEALIDAIAYANEKGAVVVCAAGNDNSSYPMFPAGYPDSLSVAATDSDDVRAWFSNYGFWVDVCAPGVDILSLQTSGADASARTVDTDFLLSSGTSMATPTTSGAMGLLMQKHPGFAPWIYRRVMQSTCNADIYSIPGNTNYIGQLGAGRIDASALLSYEEASAFCDAQVQFPSVFAAFVGLGESTTVSVKAGAWTHAVTNLQIVMFPESDHIVFPAATNYFIGDMTAGSTTNLPENTFQVEIPTNAPRGSVQYIRFELRSGDQVLDEQWKAVPVYNGRVKFVAPYDIDDDGETDVVGVYGNVLSCFNKDGSLKWFATGNTPGADGAKGLAVGDIDNDGKGESVFSTFGLTGGGVYIYVVEEDGSINTNLWPLYDGNWYSAETPALADLDGDDILEMVISYRYGLLGPGRIISVDTNATTDWTFYSDSSEYFFTAPAIEDLDDDGLPEIVILQVEKAFDEPNVIILNSDGTERSRFDIASAFDAPYDQYHFETAKPVLADLEMDGEPELLFVGMVRNMSDKIWVKTMMAFHLDGTPVSGWPILTGSGSGDGLPVPVVGDVDGDNHLEVFMVSENTHQLYGWNHDGNMIPNFPIVDSTIEGSSLLIMGDVDGDTRPEVLVIGGYEYDYEPADKPYSFKVEAWNGGGLKIHGFPMECEGTMGSSLPLFDVALDSLGGSSFGTNQHLLVTAGAELFVIDTGAAWQEEAQSWPMASHDGQRTYAHQWFDGGALKANILCTNRFGENTLDAGFQMNVLGADQAGLYYTWDFNNDGTNELAGTSFSNAVHTYTAPGIYSVAFSVSNAAGEVSSGVRENYITVTGDLTANFEATTVTAGMAPLRVHFRDLSDNIPQAWAWDFDNDSVVDSTEQNPYWDYNDPYSGPVTLTVSNSFGGSSVTTKVSYINITGDMGTVTTHYVSPLGTHIYPFKNWAQASTTLVDAVEACLTNHEVVVTNGTYYEPRATLITRHPGITVRSVNGPLVTIIDGIKEHHGIYVKMTNTVIRGLTVQNCRGDFGAGIAMGDLFTTTTLPGCKIDNCVIRWNETSGLSSQGGGVVLSKEVELMNSVIVSNKSMIGGGIHSAGAFITNCVVQYNEAQDSASAIWMSSGYMKNCLISDNSGGDSAVMFGRGGSMYNCTVVNNDSREGAVHFSDALNNNLEFYNNIVYHNVSNRDFNGGFGEVISNKYLFRNNCFSLDANGISDISVDNITADPLFVDRAAGNYRLAVNSPCRDTGYMQGAVDTNTPGHRVLIDLGTINTPGHWNNVTTKDLETKVPDLIDDTGAATGWRLIFQNNEFRTNYIDGTSTSNLYPGTARQDGFDFWTPPPGTEFFNYIRLTGLSTDNSYRFTFFGSSVNYATARFQIEGLQTGLLFQHNDQAGSLELEPSSSNVDIDCLNFGGSRGRLSVLEVEEFDVAYAIANEVDLDGNPRVFNDTVDMGCYEYDGNYPPTASGTATPNPAAPGGTIIHFSATNSFDLDGTITNYQWSFGDGSVSNGASMSTCTHSYPDPIPNYPESGWYPVRLTVWDNGGKSDSTDILVKVEYPVPGAPQNFAGTVVTNDPAEILLSWDDTAYETGYVVSRGDVAGTPIDIIIDQSDPEVSYYLLTDSYPTPWNPGTNLTTDAWGPRYTNSYTVDETNLVDLVHTYFVSPSTYLGTDSHGVDRYHTAHVVPELPEAGLYEIYVWYPEHQCGAGEWGRFPDGGYEVGTSVRHRINHAGGEKNVWVNQQENTGQWNSIGIYNMKKGNSVDIYCGNLVGYAVALMDGMRFVKRADYLPITNLSADVTNWTDTGMSDHETYTYYIKATNEYGASAWSEATVHMPTTNELPQVSITAATPTNGPYTLPVSASGSASDSDGTITNYVWNFGDGYAGSVQSGATLTNATYAYRYPGTYELTLSAFDDQGMAGTTTTTIEVEGHIPNTPTNLTAIDMDEQTIRLAWNDVSVNETEFVIQRGTDGLTFATIGTAEQDAEAYDDSADLIAPTPYYYRVASTNDDGISEWSNIAVTNIHDISGPTILRTEAPAQTNLLVIFSENVEQTTAETAANYALSHGASVLAAVRDSADPRKVMLTVTPLTQNLTGTLTINHVEDTFGNPIITDSQTSYLWQIWTRILFDCGQSGDTTLGNWNNVIDNQVGVQIANAIDYEGASTGIAFENLTAFDGISVGVDGTNLYPNTAQRDYMNTWSTDQIRLTGLDTETAYTLVFFGSETKDEATLYTDYIIGSTTLTLDCLNNTTQTVSLAETFPTGTATITVDNGSDVGGGYLSVLEIKYPQQLITAEIETSTARLSVPEGGTETFGVKLTVAPDAAKTVSVSRASGDTDITVDEGTNLTFTTNNWMTYQAVTLSAAEDDGDWVSGVATVRCSSASMSNLDVIAVEADDDENPAYTLPWSETFENDGTNAGTIGTLNEQHGWTGGGTVQSGTVQNGAQALALTNATATHTFTGNASGVEITYWAKPVFSELAITNIDANASAVFYVNTNGHIVAYNSTNATVLTGTTVSNGWNKFEIECDYSSKVWNLSINHVPVVGNFAFYGSPASFQALELTEASRDGTSFFDSITVSNTSDDSDGDGLPDSWENRYWPGDLSHSPGDPAANPDYTVMECYIAGLDPTDENAAFLISDFLPLTSVISWNSTSGRVYSIYWTSNLLSGFGNSFANGITGGAFTDSTHGAKTEGFYKIEVELSE